MKKVSITNIAQFESHGQPVDAVRQAAQSNQTEPAQYCPQCGCSRTILEDQLNSQGMNRRAKSDRIASARETIARCAACSEYFRGKDLTNAELIEGRA